MTQVTCGVGYILKSVQRWTYVSNKQRKNVSSQAVKVYVVPNLFVAIAQDPALESTSVEHDRFLLREADHDVN